MIRFYFHPTPNPAKVALFLEEAGLAYEVVPVDTSKGEQHTPQFRAINPNGKVPAIVDTDGPGGKEARVFDSTAILLYLAEKTGKFLGKAEDRAELLSWLLFIASGLRPVLRPVRAFPLCGARGLGLRQKSISAGSRAALRSAERPHERAQVHRRRQLYDCRHVGLGVA
jgi:GSH-dependent disulfide-bond oxidoreductase